MRLSRIDLHMHSTVSDGTDSPLELLQKVREAGLLYFSLSDHDAIEGNQEILSALKEDDPKFLTGVEFSCKDEVGKYHILGYGFDPEHEAIRKVVKAGHDVRITLLHERLLFLKDNFDITFPEEELDALLSLKNPGKPHLAALLVKAGHARDKKDAFENFLNKIPNKDRYTHPKDAIDGILLSGGIPMLAHPFYGTSTEWIGSADLAARVRHLKDLGLMGLEAFHSRFSAENSREILDLSHQFDLLVTAGSDYHGDNKKVAIGEITREETPFTGAFSEGNIEKLPKGLQDFFARRIMG